MDWIFKCILICSVVVICSCTNDQADKNEENKTLEGSWMTHDSIRISQIESIRSKNQKMVNDSMLVVEQLEIEQDGMPGYVVYIQKGGFPLEARMQLENDSLLRSEQYIMEQGKVVYGRFRTWHKADPPYGQIRIFYCENDDLFYVLEKQFDLEPDEKPLIAAELAFEQSKTSKDSLTAEFFSKWKVVENILKEDIILKQTAPLPLN